MCVCARVDASAGSQACDIRRAVVVESAVRKRVVRCVTDCNGRHRSGVAGDGGGVLAAGGGGGWRRGEGWERGRDGGGVLAAVGH